MWQSAWRWALKAKFVCFFAVDSETVVHSVEHSLPELAAKVSTGIDGVGENLESYGQSIITGTTELFSQARESERSRAVHRTDGASRFRLLRCTAGLMPPAL